MFKSLLKKTPNIFTLSNLLCGVGAIVLSLEYNECLWAALLIGLATIFDFFDGFLARLIGVSSEMGKQLDSMADMVTFGVAPAILAFSFVDQLILCNGLMLNGLRYGLLMTPVFAALRLAKFNIDARQSTVFYGLPSPASGIFIVSVVAIYELKSFYPLVEPIIEVLYLPNVIMPIMFVVTYFMVVDVPMFSLKFSSYKFKENRLRYIFLIGALASILVANLLAIPFIILGYIITSLVVHVFQK